MKNVTIYSTPSCGFCIQAKEYFKEKGVEYTEFNVAEDQAKAKEMIEKSGQMGVPVIIIDKEMMVGFDKAKVEKLLA